MEVDWDCGQWRGSAVSLWSLRGLETEEAEQEIQEKGRVQVSERFAVETHQKMFWEVQVEDLLTAVEGNTLEAVRGVVEEVAAVEALHLADQVKSHRTY